jgi:hypothetical protein
MKACAGASTAIVGSEKSLYKASLQLLREFGESSEQDVRAACLSKVGHEVIVETAEYGVNLRRWLDVSIAPVLATEEMHFSDKLFDYIKVSGRERAKQCSLDIDSSSPLPETTSDDADSDRASVICTLIEILLIQYLSTVLLSSLEMLDLSYTSSVAAFSVSYIISSHNLRLIRCTLNATIAIFTIQTALLLLSPDVIISLPILDNPNCINPLVAALILPCFFASMHSRWAIRIASGISLATWTYCIDPQSFTQPHPLLADLATAGEVPLHSTLHFLTALYICLGLQTQVSERYILILQFARRYLTPIFPRT